MRNSVWPGCLGKSRQHVLFGDVDAPACLGTWGLTWSATALRWVLAPSGASWAKAVAMKALRHPSATLSGMGQGGQGTAPPV